MGQSESFGDTGGDADRPVGSGRDDSVDATGTREALDALLVLRRDHRALVNETEADGKRIAVDGDHGDVAGRCCPEQAELRRPGA
jgi:hypothetical protein